MADIHWEDSCWSWSSNTLAIWSKEPTLWKRPWCWERLKAKGEEAAEDEMVTYSIDKNLSKFQEIVKDRGAWHSVVHRVTGSDTTKTMANGVDHLSTCMSAFYIPSLTKHLFMSLLVSWLDWLGLFEFWEFFIYSRYKFFVECVWFANIFSQAVTCLSVVFTRSFTGQRL